MTPTEQSLPDRIAALERTCRRTQAVALFALCALLVQFLAGARAQNDAGSIAEVLRTRRLEIVADTPQVGPAPWPAITLRAVEGAGMLELNHPQRGVGMLALPGYLGVIGAAGDCFEATSMSGSVALAIKSKADSMPRFLVARDAENGYFVSVAGDQGKGGASFDSRADGTGSLSVQSADGTGRVSASVGATGGWLHLSGKSGEPVFMADVDGHGAGSLMLGPATESDPPLPSVTISGRGGKAQPDGGAILIYNKTGQDVVTLGVDEYGNGEVGAWDRNGKGRTLKPGP